MGPAVLPASPLTAGLAKPPERRLAATSGGPTSNPIHYPEISGGHEPYVTVKSVGIPDDARCVGQVNARANLVDTIILAERDVIELARCVTAINYDANIAAVGRASPDGQAVGVGQSIGEEHLEDAASVGWVVAGEDVRRPDQVER